MSNALLLEQKKSIVYVDDSIQLVANTHCPSLFWRLLATPRRDRGQLKAFCLVASEQLTQPRSSIADRARLSKAPRRKKFSKENPTSVTRFGFEHYETSTAVVPHRYR